MSLKSNKKSKEEENDYKDDYKKSFDDFKDKKNHFLSILEKTLSYVEAHNTFVLQFINRNIDVLLYCTLFNIECSCFKKDSNEILNENKKDEEEDDDNAERLFSPVMENGKDDDLQISIDTPNDIKDLKFKKLVIEKESSFIQLVKGNKNVKKLKDYKYKKPKRRKNKYIDDSTESSSSSSDDEFDFSKINFFRALKKKNLKCKDVDLKHLNLLMKIISSKNDTISDKLSKYFHNYSAIFIQICSMKKCKILKELISLYSDSFKLFKDKDIFIKGSFVDCIIENLRYQSCLDLFYSLLQKKRFADYCKCNENFVNLIVSQIKEKIKEEGKCYNLVELAHKLLFNTISTTFKENNWDHKKFCNKFYNIAFEFIDIFFMCNDTYEIVRVYEMIERILKGILKNDTFPDFIYKFTEKFNRKIGEKIFYKKQTCKNDISEELDKIKITENSVLDIEKHESTNSYAKNLQNITDPSPYTTDIEQIPEDSNFSFEKNLEDNIYQLLTVNDLYALKIMAILFEEPTNYLINWVFKTFLYETLLDIAFEHEDFGFLHNIIIKIIKSILNCKSFTYEDKIKKLIGTIEPGIVFYGIKYFSEENSKSPKIGNINSVCVELYSELIYIKDGRPVFKDKNLKENEQDKNKKIKEISIEYSHWSNNQTIKKYINEVFRSEDFVNVSFYYNRQISKMWVESKDHLKKWTGQGYSEAHVRYIFYRMLEDFPVCDLFLDYDK